MISSILRVFKKKYQTLNIIELSSTDLVNNYKYLSSLNPNFKIAPVLKSNAYGHGIIQIAQILDPLGAPFFCVDSLYEAYQLQKAHIKTQILIMGYTDPENFKVKKLPFSFTVYDVKTLEILNQYQKGAHIHLKIDTGMHRLGISLQDLPKFLNQLKKFKNLKIEGVMSHLASARGVSDKLFQNQVQNFKEAVEIIKQAGFDPKWIHLSASDGLLNPQTRQQIFQVSNMGRVGLALYGIHKQNTKLKPVLKLITRIAQIKKLNLGDKVGYDGTFIAKNKMVIGILPIGYFDGVDRRLSNQGVLSINGVSCPIVGRVSMNITAVDITRVKNPRLDQEVVIYSNNLNHPNSIENLSHLCKTIPYDLLVHLDSSIRREIIS